MVVLDELPQHSLQIGPTEDQEMVEQLPPCRSHPSLANRVRPRRPVGQPDHLHALTSEHLVEGRAELRVPVCPAKGQSTGGCESRPGKPPEEPGSQPPASGESRAPKRGEAELQAVASANLAAPKQVPVRGRAGRARRDWAKAGVRAMDSGAARNRSGVWRAACSEGWLVNWGGPPAPACDVDSCGSMSWYKATPKSRAARRESERVHSTGDRRDNRTRRRKGPALRWCASCEGRVRA